MDFERYHELRNLLHAWKARLAENLRHQAETSPQALRRLRILFDQEGSSDSFSEWLSIWYRQAAIQWILRVLFLRVLEDRNLLGVIRIRTGDGQRMWSQLTRNLGAASYLLWCCRDAAHLIPDLFGPTEYDFLLPDDEVIQRFLDDVWRRQDPNREGWLRFDFRPEPDKADEGFQTRFIGDLYQELDSEIRERHALLQTPEFISQFILKYTLLRRFEEKDFRTVTMIDPTCGSGHFLVDGFWLFVQQYEQALGRSGKRLTATERSRIARRIIEEHIFGGDINPYASALARFRLILAACDYARPASLHDLRDLRINIVTIDSLIPYEKIIRQGTWGGSQTAKILGQPGDIQRALPVLKRRFDVVVGNPPYILASDPVKRDLYREHYTSAYSKFGLSAPFTERFLHLAMEGGYVGLINSNAFARRQFGKVLIEQVLPHYDLQAIIDLSGAYIPGHGTPTLILFARHQPPSSDRVILLSNIKGEPGIPADPAQGKVWQSVKKGYAKGPGYIDEYTDIGLRLRSAFARHPWQFGGEKSALYEKITQVNPLKLFEFSDTIGISLFTLADEIYIVENDFARRLNLDNSHTRAFVTGEGIRDWQISAPLLIVFPYKDNLTPEELDRYPQILAYLSKYKKYLENSIGFGGKTKVESGLQWFEYGRLTRSKYENPEAIVFASISTHQHFVSTSRYYLYNRHAQVIKLSSRDHWNSYLIVSSILNTNTAAFCLKQVCFNKKKGNDPVKDGWEFPSNYVGITPLPFKDFDQVPKAQLLIAMSTEIYILIEQLTQLYPSSIFHKFDEAYTNWNQSLDNHNQPHIDLPPPFGTSAELQDALRRLIALRQGVHARMIFLQEEMDWLAYEMYGLVTKAPMAEDYLNEAEYKTARLDLGQRPFELAGKGYQGDWPSGYQPAPLPDFLRPLTDARIAILQTNPDIALLEDPLYKRRWIPPNYEQEFREAAEWWLAEKLEYALEQYGKPISLREWARLLGADERVNAVMEVLTGSPAFDLENELLKVIKANAVPSRPEHYLKLSGLRKLINRSQNGEGTLPEFERKDFGDPVAWRLRGKLNIPRERFIAYREFDHNWRGESIPESGGPWFGWAGWTPLQRADALAYLLERANRAGWEVNFRQCGLRAALRDLLPELKDLPPAERSEFEAIAAACGIGLETRCYCQAFQQAFNQGGSTSPGLSAEMLGLKPIDMESEQPRRGSRKGPEKPTQMEFDL